jgi:hypothetical protein
MSGMKLHRQGFSEEREATVMLDEQSPIDNAGKNMNPQEAAEALGEWAGKYVEVLKRIDSVEAVREARESR